MNKYLALILSIIVSVPLAYGYSYAITYIPFIYFNFLLTVLFAGFSVGFIYHAVKSGALNNKSTIIIFACITAFVAYYIHWAVYCSLNSAETSLEDMIAQATNLEALTNGFQNHTSWFYITHPSQLINSISEISKVGVWSFKDAQISGVVLEFVWLIEAALIFWVACAMPLKELSKKQTA